MQTPTNQSYNMSLVPHDIDEDLDPVQIELDHYIHKEAHAFYENGFLHYRPGMRLPNPPRTPSPRTLAGDNKIPAEIQKRLDLVPNPSPVLASAKKTQKRHWYDSKEASISDLRLALEGNKGNSSPKEEPIHELTGHFPSDNATRDYYMTVDTEVVSDNAGIEPHEQRTLDKVSMLTTAFDERRQKMFLLMNEQNSSGNSVSVGMSQDINDEKLKHSSEYQDFMNHYAYSQKEMMMNRLDDEKKLIAIERDVKKGIIDAENNIIPFIPKAYNPVPTSERNEEMRQRLEDIEREKESLLEEDEEWRDTEDAVKRVRVKLLMEKSCPTSPPMDEPENHDE